MHVLQYPRAGVLSIMGQAALSSLAIRATGQVDTSPVSEQALPQSTSEVIAFTIVLHAHCVSVVRVIT
ncbi:hypothetical protein WN48_07981 [Eufriesea mexicana]|uniref:Uncharacterized protein n=1 Tax=Eufriesea mexicana TaxID=516756 RepID=A0A310SBY4_9HYME|nr:hypothetical protein WN48_07981 [Eufriesea mexicana]